MNAPKPQISELDSASVLNKNEPEFGRAEFRSNPLNAMAQHYDPIKVENNFDTILAIKYALEICHPVRGRMA